MVLGDATEQQLDIKKTLQAEKGRRLREAATELKSRLSDQLQRVVELASEKGASSWVTTLPIASHGFALQKNAFRDALCLCYNWEPHNLPSKCACGADFSTSHALTCPTGGFTIIRHNEVRDLLANLLTEVCNNVAIEPHLQPLSGEVMLSRSASTEDNVRLDIAANGFWGGRFERAFFDVRVFNPYAPSNQNTQMATTYRHHEHEKRLKYEERIREVEHSSFVPFVLSCTGGAGPCATVAIKRLGSLLSEKFDSPYSSIVAFLRCRLSFALLRASVMCLRGARSSLRHPGHFDMSVVDLATTESKLKL